MSAFDEAAPTRPADAAAPPEVRPATGGLPGGQLDAGIMVDWLSERRKWAA